MFKPLLIMTMLTQKNILLIENISEIIHEFLINEFLMDYYY